MARAGPGVGRISARPVDHYEGRILEARAMRVMIDNNLDFEVALYPYELVTYGESGQVCQSLIMVSNCSPGSPHKCVAAEI